LTRRCRRTRPGRGSRESGNERWIFGEPEAVSADTQYQHGPGASIRYPARGRVLRERAARGWTERGRADRERAWWESTSVRGGGGCAGEAQAAALRPLRCAAA